MAVDDMEVFDWFGTQFVSCYKSGLGCSIISQTFNTTAGFPSLSRVSWSGIWMPAFKVLGLLLLFVDCLMS